VAFDPSLRPAAHFTARRNWLNDPNGLLWHDGEFHLFFQCNPEGLAWGNVSWGHAVSPDLHHWTELPLALRHDESEHVFSGCVVVDAGNTSGLGTRERPPLVAVYTSHHPETRHEAQSLAVSLDRGRTWERYAGNPVLDLGSPDFRDPKVFRHGGDWVMAVSLAEQRAIRFYRSDDLITWSLLSEFGGNGSVDGVWECPDLVEVPIEGSATTAWVLLVSVTDGAPAGGSGMQYSVGDFDGTRFTAADEARWFDHGADCYAAVSYAGLSGAPVVQGWMSNWTYASDVPATEFRGSMTLPRRLSLRRSGAGLVLVQRPVGVDLPDPSYLLESVTVDGRLPLPVTHRSARILAELEGGSATRVGLEVRVGENERTVIAVDLRAGTLSLDRTRSGVDIHPRFAAVHTAPCDPTGVLRLEVHVDTASVEVFARDGEVVLTDQVFPSPDSTGLAVFADGGTAVLRRLEVTPLG